MKIHGKPPEFSGSSDIYATIIQLSKKLMSECDRLEEVGNDKAVKQHNYRTKESDAIKTQTGKSKEIRMANAFEDFAQEKLAFEKADELQTAVLERVRSLRQVLSALQTLANKEKAVAEMIGFGQDVDE